MGLGGYLAWTAVAREISKKLPEDTKILPCEGDGKNIHKIVRSPVFENNPLIFKEGEKTKLFPMFCNNPEANYCKDDTPLKAHHRYDKHIIEQMCEYYDIPDPELKCELYFSSQEEKRVQEIKNNLNEEYVVIEPYSKTNYTPNRVYPFNKWQNIVNELSNHIQIVQVGLNTSPLLDNVVDLRSRTSFREAALLIGGSRLFMSTEGGLVHAATAVDTVSVVIITGYQDIKMVSYPQNINIDISKHGPCGLKIKCDECAKEALEHNEKIILDKALSYLIE